MIKELVMEATNTLPDTATFEDIYWFILDDFEYFLKFFKSSIEVLFHFMTISQSPLLILQ